MKTFARWVGVWLLAVCALARADDSDHDRARRALASGQVLPLAEVLQRVARHTPGQVLEVELEQEGPVWLYEIKLLQAAGRLTRLKVDAATGEVRAVRPRRP